MILRDKHRSTFQRMPPEVLSHSLGNLFFSMAWVAGWHFLCMVFDLQCHNSRSNSNKKALFLSRSDQSLNLISLLTLVISGPQNTDCSGLSDATNTRGNHHCENNIAQHKNKIFKGKSVLSPERPERYVRWAKMSVYSTMYQLSGGPCLSSNPMCTL